MPRGDKSPGGGAAHPDDVRVDPRGVRLGALPGGRRGRGAASLIVADLPIEAAPGVKRVQLVAPTTPTERVKLAAGGTGRLALSRVPRRGRRARERSFLPARRRSSSVRAPVTDVPLLAGFGISTPAQAAEAASLADSASSSAAAPLRSPTKAAQRLCESTSPSLRAALQGLQAGPLQEEQAPRIRVRLDARSFRRSLSRPSQFEVESRPGRMTARSWPAPPSSVSASENRPRRRGSASSPSPPMRWSAPQRAKSRSGPAPPLRVSSPMTIEANHRPVSELCALCNSFVKPLTSLRLRHVHTIELTDDELRLVRSALHSYLEETGLIWVGTNGQDQWETAHLIRRGENYGWSVSMKGAIPSTSNANEAPRPTSPPRSNTSRRVPAP